VPLPEGIAPVATDTMPTAATAAAVRATVAAPRYLGRPQGLKGDKGDTGPQGLPGQDGQEPAQRTSSSTTSGTTRHRRSRPTPALSRLSLAVREIECWVVGSTPGSTARRTSSRAGRLRSMTTQTPGSSPFTTPHRTRPQSSRGRSVWTGRRSNMGTSLRVSGRAGDRESGLATPRSRRRVRPSLKTQAARARCSAPL
jgi:hypothetical protein